MDRSILDVHYTCRIWGKKFSSWALQDDINFAKKQTKKEQERRKERRQNNKKANDVEKRIRLLLKKIKKGQKSNKFTCKIIFNKNNNFVRRY